MSAEPVGDWEVDRLRADFGIGWVITREHGGRLKAISRDGRRTLDGPSEAVLRCHLLDAQFPRLRPA